MSLADAERLRKIHTFPSLVKYLRDDLGWPIESDDFDELTFEYEPAELGLDPKTAVKVEKILQLRPLTANQPFGVFFLHFQPKHLPVVALRRILQALTLKKRASANKSDIAAWRKNDLLFISAHGEEQQRTITFAHFREDEYQPGDLPTLRVLGWDDRDTVLHIGDVHESLANKLSWPRDEDDVDAWRQKWCSAFTLQHREVITTSKRLAVRLAELARVIRNRVSAVLAVEDKREGREGPLTKLHHVFKSALIHDLSEDDFADMYAQTIAYGLLSARVSRPAGLVADNIADMVPVTNPFLKELLEEFLHVGGRKKQGKTGLDFDELGVTEVVETLREANMEAVLRDFGDRNPQEDPVIHFYELFLKEYDAKKRMQRGVFYTPRPVVSYIVRSVHELLQTEFGLEDGLADTTTWAEMVKRFPAEPGKKGDEVKEGLKIPEGTPPNQAFVQILDPATGTGTFLVEVIHVIHKTLFSKWEAQGHGANKISELWNDYVPRHLLPRLHGYELMMAPYAIAHMKIGLKLYETGYRFESEERARIYLTNALEPPQDYSGHFEFDIPALAHEAEAVNEVKRKQRFTVVIGNPPYSNFGQLNRIPFILDLLETYKRGLDEKKLNLDDDYLKFIRFGQHLLQGSGGGVLGMISNSSFLDGLVHRKMRESLIGQFPAGFILDLHGNSRRGDTAPDGSPDKNVFDIQQGVAISLWARCASDSPPRLEHADLWGERETKGNLLANHTVTTLHWEKLDPRPRQFFFIPQDVSLRGEYASWAVFGDVFKVVGSGLNTDRDDLCIDFNRELLRSRMQRVFAGDIDSAFVDTYNFRPSSSYDPVALAKTQVFDPGSLHVCIYRPFDFRHIYYKPGFTSRPVFEVQGHMLRPNLGLLVCRQSKEPFAVLVTSTIATHKIVAVYDRTSLAPLWLYHSDSGDLVSDQGLRESNLSPKVAKTLGRFARACTKNNRLLGVEEPEIVFSYIYATLYSPTYRKRYAEFLMTDFPRVPTPNTISLFASLAHLGAELVALHLLESPKVEQFITTYTGPKNPEVGRVGWSNDTVWLDAGKTNAREGHRAAKPGTMGFKGVPEQVWDFHIGGYQVCHKWLKDRKGRTLSDDDIAHYQKIIVALNETIRIMAEIDDVIDQHGGWPAAFQTGADRDDA